MSDEQIAAREEVQIGPNDALSAIMRAATIPGTDVETAERLFALYKDIDARNRETAFMGAMARLQAKLPQINKYGQGKNSKFAKLEDLDLLIRPLLAEEGFSFSFDEEKHGDKTSTFIATLSHSAGHKEVRRLTVPVDTSATNREGKSVRTPIQDMGSTVSYARRYLMKMMLNIVEKDEDTDGDHLDPITEDQAKDLEALISEVGADRARFLKYMSVEKLEGILARDFTKAVTALQAKRKAK